MKFVQILAAVLPVVSGAATPAPLDAPEGNNITLTSFTQDGVSFIGEGINENPLNKRCTKCVGHAGLCTIGEGNCYPPDGCFVCGGCHANQARCQNPSSGQCICIQ